MRSRKGGTRLGAKQIATARNNSPVPTLLRIARMDRSGPGLDHEPCRRTVFRMLVMIHVHHQIEPPRAGSPAIERKDVDDGAERADPRRRTGADLWRRPIAAAQAGNVGALPDGPADPDGIGGRAER